ncbi:uncharacterized [Tachysurus ichikawai]
MLTDGFPSTPATVTGTSYPYAGSQERRSTHRQQSTPSSDKIQRGSAPGNKAIKVLALTSRPPGHFFLPGEHRVQQR